MQTADVVILGAGVIGASMAYHLASRGVRDVIVLDRADAPGQGSTGRATGGFRAQFGTEVNVRLSLLSREKLRAFSEEVGIDSGYRPYGYLFAARNADQLALLRAGLDMQHAAGLAESVEVTPEEMRRLNPALNTDDLIGGTFCPTDGYIRPLNLMRGYATMAEQKGVRFLYGRQRIEIQTQGTDAANRHVTGVQTKHEQIASPCVVNATGAWAGTVAAQVGVDLPVHPARRQVAITFPYAELPETMPMTIDVEDGFHLRVRDGRVLLLWPVDTAAAHPFDTTFNSDWLDGLIPRALHRIPCLRHAAVDSDLCWAGLYEMSPDKHALVGPAPGLAGFFLINGSSGHGVMHAPALSHLLTEILLDGQAQTLDIHALRPTRFAEGQPNHDNGLL